MNNKRFPQSTFWLVAIFLAVLILPGCAGKYPSLDGAPPRVDASPDYVIGAGDSVNIFVWRNSELSSTVPVRPDGKITTPLVEDLPASGKTSSQLARDMEKALAKYVKNPVVTVIVTGFVGPYSSQIRVVGQAANPQSLPYRDGMSLLDVVIAVGGLTDFAAGDRASVVRSVDGEMKQFGVQIDSLIDGGDINQNVDMLPGDILIIPEAIF